MRRGKQNKFWRINEQIRAVELRLIGPDGKQIGIISREKALLKARELELDLVEVAPKANPPVAKLIEFTKFKYEEEKKEKEERKREKKGTSIKEIWFTPLIALGDYKVRLSRVKEFLDEGARVRVIIRPKRRLEKTSPLYRVLERVIQDLKDEARAEQEPRMLGRQLVTLLVPQKSIKAKGEQENGKKDKNED